jgi:hypothetical protein
MHELPPVTLIIIRATHVNSRACAALQETAIAQIRYLPESFFQYCLSTQPVAFCGKCLQTRLGRLE